MNLKLISKDELRGELLDEDGEISSKGITDSLREIICRWGTAPKREVLAEVRRQLKLIDYSDNDRLRENLENLCSAGEVQEVFVEEESYIAPCEMRWIRVGENTAALLGVEPVPAGLELTQPASGSDWVRRVTLTTEEELVNLHLAGVRETTLSEWAKPPAFLQNMMRRQKRSSWSDQDNLSAYWELLEEELTARGNLLDDNSRVHAVVGPPGGFFGKQSAESDEGRWTAEIPNGIWCGARRGFNDNHWHWLILSVDGQERREIELYDYDEWCWALIARGKHYGKDEQISINDELLCFSFPPPEQLKFASHLLGGHLQGWQWRIFSGAPDLGATILG